MKTTFIPATRFGLFLALAVASATVHAQQRMIGTPSTPGTLSDGSYGAFPRAADFDAGNSTYLVTIPPGGIFNCTTIHVPPSTTVKFINNAANDPVYLFATGDALVEGVIDVSGQPGEALRGGEGGPGGYRGGHPGNGSTPGDGLGPGAGAGHSTVPGGGSFGTRSATSALNGPIYGNQLLMPAVGGSGGGGYDSGGGGGGGGAITLGSHTRITFNNGQIWAVGGASYGGNTSAGSGGAIRLMAPRIDGGGLLLTKGPGEGGFGRVRCDMLDSSQFALSHFGAAVEVTTIDQYLPLAIPANPPRLRIASIGGVPVPPDARQYYPVPLALNSQPVVMVELEVANFFHNAVNVNLRGTPATGSGGSGNVVNVTATVNNTAGSPTNVFIPIDLSASPNKAVVLNAWVNP